MGKITINTTVPYSKVEAGQHFTVGRKPARLYVQSWRDGKPDELNPVRIGALMGQPSGEIVPIDPSVPCTLVDFDITVTPVEGEG